MTTRANNLEGGTNGVAILTTDTGSGDAFTQASSTANQTTTRYYTNVSPIKGSLSARLTYDATGTVLLGWDAAFNQGTSPLTNGQLIIRFYFKALADSSATNTSLFQWRNATTFGGSIGLSPGLILRALTRTGTTIGTSSYVISLNTVYRVEMIVDPGTSTTTGRVRYAIYLGDSTTNLLTTAVDVSGIDCGSAPITSARWGKTAAAGTCDYVVDALYADDVSTAYIGPVAAASPPTVTVGGPVTTTLGATTTMTATAASSAGSITTYSWVQTAGPTVSLSGASSSVCTFVAGSAAHYAFTCTVQDSAGAGPTTSAAKVVYVAASVARPESIFSNAGAWSAQGAADAAAALADELDTSWAQSPANPAAAAAIRFLLTPMLAGGTTISYKIDQSAAAPPQHTTTVTLLQGPAMSTVASWTETTSTTVTTQNRVLTGPQQALVTDPNNLYIDFSTVSA